MPQHFIIAHNFEVVYFRSNMNVFYYKTKNTHVTLAILSQIDNLLQIYHCTLVKNIYLCSRKPKALKTDMLWQKKLNMSQYIPAKYYA